MAFQHSRERLPIKVRHDMRSAPDAERPRFLRMLEQPHYALRQRGPIFGSHMNRCACMALSSTFSQARYLLASLQRARNSGVL